MYRMYDVIREEEKKVKSINTTKKNSREKI